MKKMIVALVFCMIAGSASAVLYTDATNDTFLGTGSIMDIVQVEITDDGSDISFAIKLAGDIDVTDWGKYLIAIDSAPGGAAAGNGWGRPINMPTSPMDYWIGSWVDTGGGAQVWSYNGATWDQDHDTGWSAPSNDVTEVDGGQIVTITTSLSNLGLNPGDSFVFDVFSSGGGGSDSAIDSLWDPSQTVGDWSTLYETSTDLSYTTVPEPSTVMMGLLGVALIAVRRFIRRK
ncbi:MAG: PEP-CTERM sorting domain-containing protein [Verrucomicrobia bacterium]|nr:PEP-CTERM sorting domain-containing protein [Verrucomicrobiota bacterium]